MTKYKYYVQQGNQYTLKVQTGFITIVSLLLVALAVLLFTLNPDRPSILIGLLFLGMAALVFLRTTASTIIDTSARQIIVKQFSFSQPVTYYFKDYEGINSMTVSNYGVKGTSLVGLRFNVDGKEKVVKLLQSFMATKSLHEVVKETEKIMGL
jgi:hypothetical protein